MIDLVVFIFFFFFKQKTAYEMRISDWSSDVCSSDLLQVRDRLDRARNGGEGNVRHEAEQHARKRALIDVREISGERNLEVRIGRPQDRAARRIAKIGRASCRERVCQYV